MKIEVYPGKGPEHNKWRWRIKAGNGRIFACSGEAFHSRPNARRSLAKFLTDIYFVMTESAEMAARAGKLESTLDDVIEAAK